MRKHLLEEIELKTSLFAAEKELNKSTKIKFVRAKTWRNEFIPDFPGVYALFERIGDDYSVLYIGETGSLKERMSDICRTVNHTFRGQLAQKRFNGKKSKKKFDAEIETMLDTFFDDNLYLSFIKVNFGRTEIESYLVTKHQSNLLNSATKRKLKVELDGLE
jgi:hypothetical protein